MLTRRQALQALGAGAWAVMFAGPGGRVYAAKGAKPMNYHFQPPVALPRDPHQALRLQNDVVGVRLWGPATQPTLSIGKSDIWDRRWFGERQPLITLQQIREAAAAGRVGDLPRYDLYNRYDFPCPKPGAQLILGAPWAADCEVQAERDMQADRLVLTGPGKRLEVVAWVTLTRPLVVLECRGEGLAPGHLWLRVWRHRDTICPDEPVDPTLGDHKSDTDFAQMASPTAWQRQGCFGIAQDFPADPTFPEGFRVAAAAWTDLPCAFTTQEEVVGMGTPLWAEREGRISHGIVKRYAPLNASPGAAATAAPARLPERFLVLAAILTTQDHPDPAAAVTQALREAARLGLAGLHAEQQAAWAKAQRPDPAQARSGETRMSAPRVVLPSLRRPGGYYGDLALCSVDATKYCFQDAALWHADFHLNEIRAEGMLALGQFAEMLPYCDMIRTLLPSAQENAREVYGLPGAMYPLVHFPLRCRGVAHTNATWELDLGLNGLVSKPLWLYYRYTGDRDFLRQTAWPVLREGARFNAAYLSEEADGRLHLVPTVSPEHWGITNHFERNRDCLSALTLTRYLLLAAAEAAHILGESADEARTWRERAARLAPFPIWQAPSGPVWVDVAGAEPIEYNIPVPLSAVFWGDEVGLDSPAETQALARRTLEQISVWEPHRPYLDSCVRPRLGIYRPGAPVGAENLLLSYQSLRLFPAVPADQDAEIVGLWAEGGFRVWARRPAGGEVQEVRILSTLGGPCRLANPWPGREVAVTSERGTAAVGGTGGHLEFATARGTSYRISPR